MTVVLRPSTSFPKAQQLDEEERRCEAIKKESEQTTADFHEFVNAFEKSKNKKLMMFFIGRDEWWRMHVIETWRKWTRHERKLRRFLMSWMFQGMAKTFTAWRRYVRMCYWHSFLIKGKAAIVVQRIARGFVTRLLVRRWYWTKSMLVMKIQACVRRLLERLGGSGHFRLNEGEALVAFQSR